MAFSVKELSEILSEMCVHVPELSTMKLSGANVVDICRIFEEMDPEISIISHGILEWDPDLVTGSMKKFVDYVRNEYYKQPNRLTLHFDDENNENNGDEDDDEDNNDTGSRQA